MLWILTFALSFGSNGLGALDAAERFPLYGLWLLSMFSLGCALGGGDDCGRWIQAAIAGFFV